MPYEYRDDCISFQETNINKNVFSKVPTVGKLNKLSLINNNKEKKEKSRGICRLRLNLATKWMNLNFILICTF